MTAANFRPKMLLIDHDNIIPDGIRKTTRYPYKAAKFLNMNLGHQRFIELEPEHTYLEWVGMEPKRTKLFLRYIFPYKGLSAECMETGHELGLEVEPGKITPDHIWQICNQVWNTNPFTKEY